ncbi:exonuclease [Panus rudis PR-1116 ss-1]|nr:exonuclease [Panus rudis PR-1116 ss-1]
MRGPLDSTLLLLLRRATSTSPVPVFSCRNHLRVRAMTTTTTPSQKPDFLLVLDFEATCGDAVSRMEIIEFPTLVYDLKQDKVISTFHEYVKPVLHPTLTPFCTELTGITQDVVDKADTFPEVWNRYRDFLKRQGVFDNPDAYIFVTCGQWDLKTMLPNQLEISESTEGRDDSGELVSPYNRFINLKQAFRRHYKTRFNAGMLDMLSKLKMEVEGRHHSGIDDCRNILRIIQRMRSEGWEPKETR